MAESDSKTPPLTHFLSFLGGAAVFACLLVRANKSLAKSKDKLRQLQEEVEVIRCAKREIENKHVLTNTPTTAASSTSASHSCCLDVKKLEIAFMPNARKRRNKFDPAPRELYLSWDDYFMVLATSYHCMFIALGRRHHCLNT